MKYTKDFDKYLYIKKGRDEYLADKVKAARIGGSVSRLSPQQARKNTMAMGLSNIRTPRKMLVLCLQDFELFERGKKYNITMAPGAIMLEPIRYEFKNWVHFLDYFKRYKEI